MPPNGLELSCPAEAGGLTRIVRPASGPSKRPRKRRPPGQSKILVISQGFSELLGSPRNPQHYWSAAIEPWTGADQGSREMKARTSLANSTGCSRCNE